LTSLKTRMVNVKNRLLKPIVNSNYEPTKMRARLHSGDPVIDSTKIELSHSHLEVWGPSEAKSKILYLAGGGFCFGPNNHYREFLTDIASTLNAEVHLLHYRLAPEHPFPAAFEDTLEALQAISQDHRPIAVMGDSAGATLVMSALMHLRDEGIQTNLKSAVYLSPFTDLALTGLSLVSNARRDPVFSTEALIHKVHHYLQGHNPTDAKASPFWGDCRDLPPSLFLVGSTEVLYDDSSRMVKCGQEAGSDFQLSSYPNMPHIFPTNRILPEAKQARKEIIAFLQNNLST
jgi:epsilon-lactone hydrolase